MADPRQYYVPPGGAMNSVNLSQPPAVTRQLQSSLRNGGLQHGHRTAANTGLPKPKGKRHVTWAGDKVLSPAASVATSKEPTSETQPAVIGVLQSPSIIDQKQSSSRTDSQMCYGSDTVTGDQLMAVAAPQSSASDTTPKPSVENEAQDDAISGKAQKLRKKESFIKNWGRARNKVSSAFLGGPMSHIDGQPAAKGVDHSMALWRSFVAERKHREIAMEGPFDSFKDAMEGAMDSKYRELRGEGGFLIHEEASSSLAGPSDKVPTEAEAVALTAEVPPSWLKYAEEEEGVEVCEPPPNGIQQHDLSLRSHPPTGVKIAEPGDVGSTSPDGDYQPTASITQMSNGHRKVLDPTNAGSAASSVQRKPIPGTEAGAMQASTTQTAESSRSPVPYKGRQDSVQTFLPQTTAAQAVAPQSAQMQETYPVFTDMDREQDLQ